MELVKLSGVQKSYTLGETQVPALRGVDLEIRSGEFTSVIGASGSGKSTLLNLVGCLDRPDAGSIKIDGQEITSMEEAEQCRLRNEKIGFIFQSFNLVPVLNVWENVELPLLVRNVLSESEKKQRVSEVLEAVGLEKYHEHRPDQLSGGQRQRVAIARALVTRPSLVLADEPTANLDSKTAHRILDLMADLNRTRNVTFLFCSHDEKLMGRVGRIVRIEDGVIVE
ncbi:MAG: ABC transporter ATP-binding protein [Bdellovibrionales bacterium]